MRLCGDKLQQIERDIFRAASRIVFHDEKPLSFLVKPDANGQPHPDANTAVRREFRGELV